MAALATVQERHVNNIFPTLIRAINHIIEDKSTAAKIERLFVRLCGANFQKFEIKGAEVTIEHRSAFDVQTAIGMLHVPKKIVFTVIKEGLEFSEKGEEAPYFVESFYLMRRTLAWFLVTAKDENITFSYTHFIIGCQFSHVQESAEADNFIGSLKTKED